MILFRIDEKINDYLTLFKFLIIYDDKVKFLCQIIFYLEILYYFRTSKKIENHGSYLSSHRQNTP